MKKTAYKIFSWLMVVSFMCVVLVLVCMAFLGLFGGIYCHINNEDISKFQKILAILWKVFLIILSVLTFSIGGCKLTEIKG